MALIGTPCGASKCASTLGHCLMSVRKRELPCAAGRPCDGSHGVPSHAVRPSGGLEDFPSHHGRPSGVIATLVNSVLRCSIDIALGLLAQLVPVATANVPASGLIAQSRPSLPMCNQ